MSDTIVTFAGNLTADPDHRFTPTGKQVTVLRVAVNRRRKIAEGTYEDGTPTFHRVEAWNSLGENVTESLSKGDRVVVIGRLTTDTWDKDGETQYGTKVTADVVAADLQFAKVAITKTRRNGAEEVPAPGDEDAPLEDYAA